jgi:hypothetical protein
VVLTFVSTFQLIVATGVKSRSGLSLPLASFRQLRLKPSAIDFVALGSEC